MDFDNLIKYVKAQGCRVTVYKTKKTVHNAIGLFYEEPYPNIKMAIKGRSKKLVVSTLLHEYAHFCQWMDGFSKYLDGICWSHNVHDEWVRGKIELTEREIEMIRASMLSVEYDAELRAIKIGKELRPDSFDANYHLREAQSYIAAIKWSFGARKEWKKRPSWRLYPAKQLTHEELFAPLTEKEKEILKGIKPRD
jgi:hypothetical protein